MYTTTTATTTTTLQTELLSARQLMPVPLIFAPQLESRFCAICIRGLFPVVTNFLIYWILYVATYELIHLVPMC